VMDWETPLDAFGGKTALEIAKIGMKEHSSQTDAFAVKSHGTYDNSKFGLYFTTVGEDVEKNDFLEHIDPDASANYLAEHAGEIEAQKAASAAELAAAAEIAQAAPDEEPESTEESDGEAEADEVEESEEMPDDAGEADEVEASGDMPDDAAKADAFEATVESADGIAEETAEETPAERAEAGADDGSTVQAQTGLQAEDQLLTAAQPTATQERDGGSILPVVMIGAGVAALGVGAWYGWQYTRGRGRRRRRRR